MEENIPDKQFYNIPFEVKSFNNMPYRTLGKSGLKVSNIGLGTWKMGFPETGDGARIDGKTSLKILDKSLDLGVTFWDTANRYNNASGNSERIIGSWFKNNPEQRRNIVLATKLAGTMDGNSPNHCGLSRTNIMEAVYASLERLQSDHIDLLYFHAYDPSTPQEESLMAIEDLVKQDLIRYFAVSNFNTEQLKTFQSFEKSLSPRVRILAVQNRFDILTGEDDAFKGTLDYAAAAGISFVAWSPMARGLLTDRYLDPKSAGPGDRLFDEGGIEEKITAESLQKLRDLSKIAKELDVELSQMVIAYMLTLPGMGPLIPSSSDLKQLESNAAASKIVLDEHFRGRISEAVRKTKLD